VSEALPVVYAEPDVGEVIATEGRIVSTPFPPPPPPIPPAPPVTILVTVSPFPVKLAVTLTVVVVVGVKRTVTDCFAPAPARLNGLPDTIENGGGTDALPDTVPPAVLDTVKVWSAELPRGTPPKFTVPLGLTLKSLLATALALGEQALWLPLASTALTAT